MSEIRFNDVLKINPELLAKEGLINQPYLRDDHYYIDIFKFKETNVEEFKNSYNDFLNFFNKFFQLLKLSTNNGLQSLSYSDVKNKKDKELKAILAASDAPFKGAFYQLNFKEADGFNLGYSQSLEGKSSIGLGFKFVIIKAAQELLQMNIEDPEVFCLLPFLQDGIGCDRVSDMFISINYAHFLKYTERKLKELCVDNVREFEILGITYNLHQPAKFKAPLILISKKFVKPLPKGIGWDGIFDTYDENSELRNRLNILILSKYKSKKDVTKEKVSQMLKENPAFLKKIIQEFKETTSFGKLEESLIKEIEAEIEAIDPPDLASLKDQVFFILNKFKWFVESKGTWKMFYQKEVTENKESYKRPLSEDHIQRAFHIVAELLADKFSIDVTPEADTGRGTVDFKFSKGASKVLVEVKLSTHKEIVHGYEGQLSEYITSETPVYSYFLVVRLQNATKELMRIDNGRLDRLLAAEKKSSKSEKMIFLVNAIPRLGASVPTRVINSRRVTRKAFKKR